MSSRQARFKRPDPSSVAWEVGHRFRLTAAAKAKWPRMRVHSGTVVTPPKSGGSSMRVLFDGAKSATTIYSGFLEPCDATTASANS